MHEEVSNYVPILSHASFQKAIPFLVSVDKKMLNSAYFVGWEGCNWLGLFGTILTCSALKSAESQIY